jgi:hypothetical protein
MNEQQTMCAETDDQDDHEVRPPRPPHRRAATTAAQAPLWQPPEAAAVHRQIALAVCWLQEPVPQACGAHERTPYAVVGASKGDRR